MDIKTEGLGFVKTLAAIGASFGAVWGFFEPMVEDYIHDQINLVHEEDVKRIDKLEDIVEEDYNNAKGRRNEIVNEILYIYPQSRLRVEQ